MIVKINNSPNIIAKTITAGNDNNITIAKAAPIINPITKINAVNNMIAIMPKQFLFFVHFSSLLS